VSAKTALELADAVRRGDEQAGPSTIWEAANRETSSTERIDLYTHAMFHAGFLVPGTGGTFAACPRCGADLS